MNQHISICHFVTTVQFRSRFTEQEGMKGILRVGTFMYENTSLCHMVNQSTIGS